MSLCECQVAGKSTDLQDWLMLGDLQRCCLELAALTDDTSSGQGRRHAGVCCLQRAVDACCHKLAAQHTFTDGQANIAAMRPMPSDLQHDGMKCLQSLIKLLPAVGGWLPGPMACFR